MSEPSLTPVTDCARRDRHFFKVAGTENLVLMKIINPSRKFFHPTVLVTLAIVTFMGISIRAAQAYTVTLEQVESNVVATGSGAINLTGLTFFSPGAFFTARIRAETGVIFTGPPGGSGNVDLYTGITGPTSFGNGFFFIPNTGSGDIVGIDPQEFGGCRGATGLSLQCCSIGYHDF